MANLIKVDRNGTKYFEGEVPCTRCGGEGVYIMGVCNGKPVLSPVDNGICFKCGGSGKQLSKWKEYTPEYEAKLAARRQARHDKWLAEHAEELEAARIEQERKAAEAKRLQEEAEAARIAEEARIAAEKALSNHVGSIGDKIDTTAVYAGSAHFEVNSYMGYGTETMYIHRFKVDGNTFIWKTSKALGWWNNNDEWETPEEGTQVHLKGTIKEHSEYKDEKQTVLTRCKVK